LLEMLSLIACRGRRVEGFNGARFGIAAYTTV
jgi:hypothetical protein